MLKRVECAVGAALFAAYGEGGLSGDVNFDGSVDDRLAEVDSGMGEDDYVAGLECQPAGYAADYLNGSIQAEAALKDTRRRCLRGKGADADREADRIRGIEAAKTVPYSGRDGSVAEERRDFAIGHGHREMDSADGVDIVKSVTERYISAETPDADSGRGQRTPLRCRLLDESRFAATQHRRVGTALHFKPAIIEQTCDEYFHIFSVERRLYITARWE